MDIRSQTRQKFNFVAFQNEIHVISKWKFRWNRIPRARFYSVRNILSPFNELRRYGPMVEYRFFFDAKGSPLRRISICSNVCCSTIIIIIGPTFTCRKWTRASNFSCKLNAVYEFIFCQIWISFELKSLNLLMNNLLNDR